MELKLARLFADEQTPRPGLFPAGGGRECSPGELAAPLSDAVTGAELAPLMYLAVGLAPPAAW